MEVQRFEQAILKLAFETDARITTASVAYYLGIPSREANRLLNQLLEEGVLELDSDSEGNLYYRVPNQGDCPPVLPQASVGPDGPPKTGTESAGGSPANSSSPQQQQQQQQPRPSQKPSMPLISIDGDDDAPAFSPRQDAQPSRGWNDAQRPLPSASTPYSGHDGGLSADGPSPVAHRARFGRAEASLQEQTVRPAWTRSDNRRNRTVVRDDDPLAGWTTRFAAPDASVNSCGASPMVLSTTARCEPKPLPDTKPTVVSCTGFEQNSSTSNASLANNDFGYGYVNNGSSTALAATSHGDFVLARENHIEQPEHQPGMALLLSLILCGTGQIYNGEVSKGIIMMVLCFLLWFVLLGWVVHIWSIVDAVVVAERINRKHN